jgi:hypothetical protein
MLLMYYSRISLEELSLSQTSHLTHPVSKPSWKHSRLLSKCDGTRAETRFRLSAKWTNPFKSPGASVQLTTGSRGVHISGSNAGFTTFWGSVKSTGYPLHLPDSPSLPLPCVTMCYHISAGLYYKNTEQECQLLHNTWWSFCTNSVTLLSNKLISGCVQSFLHGASACHTEDRNQFRMGLTVIEYN